MKEDPSFMLGKAHLLNGTTGMCYISYTINVPDSLSAIRFGNDRGVSIRLVRCKQNIFTNIYNITF